MIARRTFIASASAAIVAQPFAARGQGGMPRIGLLSSGTDPDKPNPVWVAFFRGLDALGYAEGRNIAIERRFAGGKTQLLPGFVADLAQRRVDVLVVTGDIEAALAKAELPATPIVMMLVQDPVGTGLVASLARPGGNITGLSTLAPELYGKRLQLLQEAIPNLTRVGLLVNPDSHSTEAASRDAAAGALKLGVQLRQLPVRTLAELEDALATASREHLEALVVGSDGLIYNQRARIAEVTIAARLPTMLDGRYFVDVGGLMSYGPNIEDLARRAAGYVDRILRGAKPADLPVEQPTLFELVINLKTAKALGLSLPHSLLLRADEVIE